MHVYALKSCDTCRKALKSLKDAGHDPQVTDIRADGIPADLLDRLVARFGDAIVNRRSTTWRGLDDAERGGDPATLIAAHPTLMKRPVIDHDGTLYLGWTPETRAALT
ncbi:arsenate reductase [Palleronia salina]|uniref:Arsenate reductase n=1 Tax=Palleronia salina TaxID=313368 RepID=A0A1M6G414_9RHOB|nr:ArsC/Spx/MgsR family protein [Palleronia salina]SHJ04557.1 arsenate reductase [Palleronia salina]